MATVTLLTEKILRQSSCLRPPVPSNLVGLFDPGRHVHIQAIRCNGRRGGLWFQDGEWLIQVNAREPERAQRFTIFHEGFHILRQTGVLAVASDDPAAVEWLADRFAACLLMPEGWMREVATRVKRCRAMTMAGVFQVSQSAMRIRLAELGLVE